MRVIPIVSAAILLFLLAGCALREARTPPPPDPVSPATLLSGSADTEPRLFSRTVVSGAVEVQFERDSDGKIRQMDGRPRIAHEVVMAALAQADLRRNCARLMMVVADTIAAALADQMQYCCPPEDVESGRQAIKQAAYRRALPVMSQVAYTLSDTQLLVYADVGATGMDWADAVVDEALAPQLLYGRFSRNLARFIVHNAMSKMGFQWRIGQ